MGKFPKVSARKFGRMANVNDKTVGRYYRAWELAADDGLVPHAHELNPESEIELPDADWNKYYKAAAYKTKLEYRIALPCFVYKFWKNGQVLYIGKAVDLEGRIKQHHKYDVPWMDYDKITAESFATEVEALAAEREYIKAEKPLFNTIHNRGG